MKGAPPLAHEKLAQIDTIVRAVDQRGRDMDQRWGIGRLPALVPIEMAERFRIQKRKFSAATLDLNRDQTQIQGQGMLRAYAKLDEVATAQHGEPVKPEQWEFEVEGVGLVVLVRDIADTGRADTGGRQCQVWSLDEIANVIRNHPLIAAAKEAFPGAIVESVRPEKAVRNKLDDELADLPFTLAG